MLRRQNGGARGEGRGGVVFGLNAFLSGGNVNKTQAKLLSH